MKSWHHSFNPHDRTIVKEIEPMKIKDSSEAMKRSESVTEYF